MQQAVSRTPETAIKRRRTPPGSMLHRPPPISRAAPCARERRVARRHADAWVASASPDGDPHLVPLSYAWDGTHLILATVETAITTRNFRSSGAARLALGTTRDVVLIDAVLEGVVAVADATDGSWRSTPGKPIGIPVNRRARSCTSGSSPGASRCGGRRTRSRTHRHARWSMDRLMATW